MARLIIFIFWLIAYPVFAVNQTANQEPLDSQALAPAFDLRDLRGRGKRLDDYKGKVLLINFWATWCAPCLAEMPDLVKLQKVYGFRGLQIIGVTYPPQNPARVRQIARRLKLNYPILFGNDKMAGDYNVGEVLPTSIVVDREGKIRARILGILEPEEFDEKIRPLLVATSDK